jgi:hypothetical protein
MNLFLSKKGISKELPEDARQLSMLTGILENNSD